VTKTTRFVLAVLIVATFALTVAAILTAETSLTMKLALLATVTGFSAFLIGIGEI
jgi:hypothetical protein